MVEKYLVGWVIKYNCSELKQTLFYADRHTYNRGPNQEWEDSILSATIFTSLKKLLGTLRRIRSDDQAIPVDFKNVKVIKYYIYIEKENIDEGDIAETRKDLAIKKLNIDEVEVLGLGGIAVRSKLNDESKDSIFDFYPNEPKVERKSIF